MIELFVFRAFGCMCGLVMKMYGVRLYGVENGEGVNEIEICCVSNEDFNVSKKGEG